MTQEALKLALEALKNGMKFVWTDPEREAGFVAIDAIKEALAQPECARCKDLEEQAYDLLGQLKVANLKWSVAHPWVGLTDEDVFAVLEELQNMYHRPPSAIFAQAIEAKLKEKNT